MTDYVLTLSDAEIARFRFMAARARADEADSWRTAGIVPGARVADVGCGPGAVIAEMATVVGPAGFVVGVDADPTAVSSAVALLGQAGLSNTEVLVGQANDTGLEPGSVDVAVMRHVLAHNGGHEQDIVGHLAALVRPGGCVYLVDVDMTAFRMLDAEPDLLDLTDRYTRFHQARGNDPLIGLRLGRLLAGAGLEVLEHKGSVTVMSAPQGMRPPAWVAREAMIADGIADAADIARWQAALQRVDAATERPTLGFGLFTAIGRRPA